MDRRQRPAIPPKIREISFEDYPQIASVESRNSLDIKPCEEWQHLWNGNPLYRELGETWPIGWLMEDESVRVVGSICNIPLAYELNGRRIIASTARSWAVDPEYRSFSLSLLDRVLNQKNVDLYVNNTVSAMSAKAFSFFECAQAPAGAWDMCGFWITSYRPFLQLALAERKVPLAKLASVPAAAGLFCRDRLARLGRPRGFSTGIEIEFCPQFDERFDAFWDELRKSNPGRLLSVRSREMLDWHFKYALLQKRAWVLAAAKGPRLLAYGIFDRLDNPKIGLKRARLLDFQSVEGGRALLDLILAQSLHKCREEGVHVLEDIGCWSEAHGPTAPYHRKLPCWTFFYKAMQPGLESSLREPNGWSPSTFDGDASL